MRRASALRPILARTGLAILVAAPLAGALTIVRNASSDADTVVAQRPAASSKALDQAAAVGELPAIAVGQFVVVPRNIPDGFQVVDVFNATPDGVYRNGVKAAGPPIGQEHISVIKLEGPGGEDRPILTITVKQNVSRADLDAWVAQGRGKPIADPRRFLVDYAPQAPDWRAAVWGWDNGKTTVWVNGRGVSREALARIAATVDVQEVAR